LLLALVVLIATSLTLVAVVVPLAREVAGLNDVAMVFDAENVWPVVVSIAWVQYFQSNPRVKETFVR
jgi:hypothetical protein